MSLSVIPSSAMWQNTLPEAMSPDEVAWLAHSGSLSARLGTLGRFSVAVVCEGEGLANREDGEAPSVETGALLWRRDVVLHVDDEAVGWGPSATPLGRSANAWAAPAGLGTPPLGDILFDDATITRSALQFRVVRLADPLFPHAAPACRGGAAQRLWARRSVFIREHAPLVVAECFLPRLWDRAGVARS